MNRTTAALAALQNHVGTHAKIIDEYLNTAQKQCDLTKSLMVAAAEEALKKPVLVAQHVLAISGRSGAPDNLVAQLKSLAAKNLPISSVVFDPNTLTLYVTITNKPD